MDPVVRKIDALSRMTAKNGCTAAEAVAAQAKIRALMKEVSWSLSSDDEMIIRREKSKISRERKCQWDLAAAYLTLVDEVRRRRGVKRAEAETIVNETLEKLLNVTMQQKRLGREMVWIATEMGQKQQ
jgi:hypothetical protein